MCRNVDFGGAIGAARAQKAVERMLVLTLLFDGSVAG